LPLSSSQKWQDEGIKSGFNLALIGILFQSAGHATIAKIFMEPEGQIFMIETPSLTILSIVNIFSIELLCPFRKMNRYRRI
jgi:hypothetical protein